MELFNQRGQEIKRQADSINHTQIDDETIQLNNAWNKKLADLQNHLDTLNVLCGQWQEFEKRVEHFENQLIRLDERNRNIDTAIKSKQHLDDTKHIYQVSAVLKIVDFLLFLRIKYNGEAQNSALNNGIIKYSRRKL